MYILCKPLSWSQRLDAKIVSLKKSLKHVKMLMILRYKFNHIKEKKMRKFQLELKIEVHICLLKGLGSIVLFSRSGQAVL